MNLLSRNMAQIEVFILQIKFPSLNLPGQCYIKICQVHAVSLEDEVTIVEQVLEHLDTKVDPVTLFLSCGPLQLSAHKGFAVESYYSHFAIGHHVKVTMTFVTIVEASVWSIGVFQEVEFLTIQDSLTKAVESYVV